MGPAEIAALQDVAPNWKPFLILAAIMMPVILALLNRERKKQADPLAGVMAKLTEMDDEIRDLQRAAGEMRERYARTEEQFRFHWDRMERQDHRMNNIEQRQR